MLEAYFILKKKKKKGNCDIDLKYYLMPKMFFVVVQYSWINSIAGEIHYIQFKKENISLTDYNQLKLYAIIFLLTT